MSGVYTSVPRPDDLPISPVPDTGQVLFISPSPARLAVHLSHLRGAGYGVRLAAHVAEAVAIAGVHCPELVVLDLGDPPRAGLDMLRELKADLRLGTVPVVTMASWGTLDEARLGLDLGARDYVIEAETTPGALARCIPMWTGTEPPLVAAVGAVQPIAGRLLIASSGLALSREPARGGLTLPPAPPRVKTRGAAPRLRETARL